MLEFESSFEVEPRVTISFKAEEWESFESDKIKNIILDFLLDGLTVECRVKQG